MGSEENQPLLQQIQDLSADAIEIFLENKPVGMNLLRWYPGLIAWESKLLWFLSGASIIVRLFNYILSFVTLMFMGHLGAVELAAAYIASVGIQGLAYGIMLGMSSAVQTVCGQGYGAKQYGTMGIIFQRAIVLHIGASLVLTFVYWYLGRILKAIGQSDSISEDGQVFSRGLILQQYAFAISCPMQRFLQAQNIVNPLAYMAVGVFLLHVLLNWLVVYVFDWGLFGAALTLSFSWWVLVIVQGLFIILSPPCKQTWVGFSIEAFRGIWPFFKLSVASTVMLCLEIWYFKGLVLITGILPNPTISLDSISICMNYFNWDIQVMLGIASAASIRVSNELEAGHPMVAKFSVIVVNITSILVSVVFTIIVLIFRVGLGKFFSSDSQVIEATSSLAPLLAISVFLNGIQPILSGVAIGSGWQAAVAYVNIVTYYIIGLPIGCTLGFKTRVELKLFPARPRAFLRKQLLVFSGFLVGDDHWSFLQTLFLFILTARTNWKSEVVKAANRLKESADEEQLNQVEST
ncbi:Protein TRANSPARENT TESTA 12 [Abeliophyllum distichum]|uniref:Protein DETOXIFICATION n=1 Tax=Abeliophyllum distichum TaxID=126358 RepID=A0ABD1PLX9_9LAMI